MPARPSATFEEALYLTAVTVGVPKAVAATHVLLDVFAERELALSRVSRCGPDYRSDRQDGATAAQEERMSSWHAKNDYRDFDRHRLGDGDFVVGTMQRRIA